MTPQNRQCRNHWKLALVVALGWHGLLLAVLILVPGRSRPQVSTAREEFMSFLMADSLDEEGCHHSQGERNDQEPFEVRLVAHSPTSVFRPVLGLGKGPNPERDPGDPGPDRETAGTGSGPVTRFFGISARGQRLVYVLDASASMGREGLLIRACKEVRASLQQLPRSVRFQVLVYRGVATPLLAGQADWLEPSPKVLGAVNQALDALVAEGKTDHGEALKKALTHQPDVIFLLTDADDLTPEHLRLAALHNRHGAIIHTVEMAVGNRGRPGMPLQRLARDHGGEYRAPGR